MKLIIGLLVFTSITIINTAQAEGDIEMGRALSSQCTACHGTYGVSNSEQFPNLAGQKANYLASQLAKYQSGERVNLTMKAIVGPLDAQNIKDIAAYYASNDNVVVASYSYQREALFIPYVDVGGTMYSVEMALGSAEGSVFSVTYLEERELEKSCY